MKKRLLCVIFTLAVILSGCAEKEEYPVIDGQHNEYENISGNQEKETENSDIGNKDESMEKTEEKQEEQEAAQKTEESDNTYEALFDASKFSDIEVPEVVDAEMLVQDKLFDGSYEYKYIVSIPKIDSAEPGALAFNKKIYSEYADLLDVEANKKQGFLYQITYESSAYDGIILVHMIENYGFYQSEGAHLDSYFYYDSIKDTELTAEEYAVHFGLDTERLSELARWCLDTEWEMPMYSYEMTDSGEIDFVESPELNKLYFVTRENAAVPSGYKVTKDKVYLYFRTDGYVTYTECVEIDVKTAMPSNINFGISCEPTGIYEGSADGIYVTYENGKITNALVSESVPVKQIILTSTQIRIITDLSYRGLDFDTYVEVNGNAVENMGGSSELWGENLGCDTYYIPRIQYDGKTTVKVMTKQ